MAVTSPTKPVILQVLPALGDGGVERSTLEMAAFLQKNGYPNHVASAGGRLEYELSQLGIPHHRRPLATKNPLKVFLNAFHLAKLIHANGISLVHARSRAPAWSTWIALNWVAKYPQKPVFVTTFHGTYGAKSRVKRFYNRVMLAGKVIANSAFIARHIAATYGYPIDKIKISQRGVDFSRIERELATDSATASTVPVKGPKKHTKGTQSNPWQLLCVGRLTRWKGQEALLDAMAEVKRLAPEFVWELSFVGGAGHKDGYARDLKKQAERLGLSSHVRWLGSRTDIMALNAAADLAISPSLRPEAFGRASVEAMAMGTPVIATKLGGSLETVVDGKTGWLVDVALPTEDIQTATHPGLRADVPQVLAQTILQALTDPARLASMGQEASRHVRQYFTSDMTCAAELEAYCEALGLIAPASVKPTSGKPKKKKFK